MYRSCIFFSEWWIGWRPFDCPLIALLRWNTAVDVIDRSSWVFHFFSSAEGGAGRRGTVRGGTGRGAGTPTITAAQWDLKSRNYDASGMRSYDYPAKPWQAVASRGTPGRAVSIRATDISGESISGTWIDPRKKVNQSERESGEFRYSFVITGWPICVQESHDNFSLFKIAKTFGPKFANKYSKIGNLSI